MKNITHQNIKNFAIIAHIDHGKSTLADRLLEFTGTVEKGKHEEQMLDKNPISRERGITIKLAPVRMKYSCSNNEKVKDTGLLDTYILNLIDTPGHVDFSYEVERTLACVEGALLLVDSTQGIQAQTIAHMYKALEQNLTIIPVINKIDLPSANVEKAEKEIMELLGVKSHEILHISAKTGLNVDKVIKEIINKIPSPITLKFENENITRGLIFDSYYDKYRGVIAFVRVFNGSIKKGMKMKLFATGASMEVAEVGIFSPDLVEKNELDEGEIGYVVTNLKDIHEVRVGDTIYDFKLVNEDENLKKQIQLSGYRKVKPMVYASVFTTDPNDYLNLKKALEKLELNDSALTYEGIYSKALGSGFRTGFLGILHADVVRERLEREFGLSLILTPPSVEFLPDYLNRRYHYKEPIVEVTIVTPQEYVGSVMKLCETSRGTFITMDNKTLVYLVYEIPLAELITYFFDKLKNVSSGYASLDWSFKEYRDVEADKLTLLLNSEPVEEFSEFVVDERSFERGRELTQKLRELIPRQQYEVKIQAQYKGKIIASERIAPFRKDVLIKSGKVIGAGDVGRKRKVLERQKEGKKQMKAIGRVEIPKEAFLKLFKR